VAQQMRSGYANAPSQEIVKVSKKYAVMGWLKRNDVELD
jgi:hypothetical protein